MLPSKIVSNRSLGYWAWRVSWLAEQLMSNLCSSRSGGLWATLFENPWPWSDCSYLFSFQQPVLQYLYHLCCSCLCYCWMIQSSSGQGISLCYCSHFVVFLVSCVVTSFSSMMLHSPSIQNLSLCFQKCVFFTSYIFTVVSHITHTNFSRSIPQLSYKVFLFSVSSALCIINVNLFKILQSLSQLKIFWKKLNSALMLSYSRKSNKNSFKCFCFKATIRALLAFPLKPILPIKCQCIWSASN